MNKNKGLRRFLFVCLAPAVILFFIFMIVPTFNVFRMSLFEKGAYTPTETFVGFNNFKMLMADTKFIRSMQNTILLVVVVTIITFAFAFASAKILQASAMKACFQIAECSFCFCKDTAKPRQHKIFGVEIIKY